MPADRLDAIAQRAIAEAVEAEYPSTEVEVVRLADVESRAVTWLWHHRIARGRLCLLAGDPGVGKSFLTCALATAVSRGSALPGDVAREPADVLLLSAEDSAEDTIRPRCEAMGADLARVRVVQAVRRNGKAGFFSLADDLEALERELDQHPAALLVVDPVDAYVGLATDTHRAAAIRSLLGPLAAVADRTEAAVVAVQHLTKGGRDRAIYRPQGSIGYVAAARTALLVAADPDDPTSPVRHVAGLKSNLGPLADGIAFTLEGGRFGWLPDRDGRTADQLLTVAAAGEDGGALAEAQEVLREVLADGAVAAKRAAAEVMEAVGCSLRTVKSAKAALGVVSVKGGMGSGWSWSLPKGANDGHAEGQFEVKRAKGASEISLHPLHASEPSKGPPAEPDGVADGSHVDRPSSSPRQGPCDHCRRFSRQLLRVGSCLYCYDCAATRGAPGTTQPGVSA